MRAHRVVVIVLLALAPRVHADGEGKTCLDCDDGPTLPGPTQPPAPQGQTGDTGDTDDDTYDDVGTVEDPAPSHPEWGVYEPPQHESRVITRYSRPKQLQGYVRLYNGGHVPLANREHPPSLAASAPGSAPVTQVAGIDLPGGFSMSAWHPLNGPTLPNSAERVYLIGQATAAQQQESIARKNQKGIVRTLTNVVRLAGSLDNPDAVIHSAQQSAVDLFGVESVEQFNAEVVNDPRDADAEENESIGHMIWRIWHNATQGS